MSVDWLVHIIINSLPEFNQHKKHYRYLFTLKGCQKYYPADVKSSRNSFLHGWKRKPKHIAIKHLSDGYFANQYYERNSWPLNFEKKYSAFLDGHDIKVACRDFIFAERYYSLLQFGQVDDCKNIEVEFNRTGYDTHFLVSSPPSTPKKKTHFRLLSFKSYRRTSNKKRPLSMTHQVRYLFVYIYI